MAIENEQEIIDVVKKWIKDNHYESVDIYADYDDEIPEDKVKKILSSEDPEFELYNYLDDVYWESRVEEIDYLMDKIEEDLSEEWEFDDDELEFVREILEDNISIELPVRHYLDQDVDVTMILDVGDSNYEFTTNSIAPAYYSNELESSDDIPDSDESSLVYLVEQQGYNKKDLYDSLVEMSKSEDKIDYKKSYPFLKSVYIELLNSSSSMNAVSFFKTMTLEELMKIHEEGKKNKGFKVKIEKDTRCGLLDFGSGGGSILDINLEKDMEIPYENFFHLDLDSNLHYGASEIYGGFPA